MKLKEVHVETYRSIVDTGVVPVEEGVTVVIGKNEQGKTNFLKAIRSFNADQSFSPGDLPNHLRPALEDRAPEEIPIVTLRFALEPQDIKKLSDVVQQIDAAAEIKCVKYYGNNYGFSVLNADGKEEALKYAPPDLSQPTAHIKATVADLKSRLKAHGERVPAFAANSDKVEQITSSLLQASLLEPAEADDSIKTFTTSIKALTAQDQPILDDITAAVKELEAAREAIQLAHQHDPALALKQRLPNFILHSTKADHIPNEVSVAEFTKDPDATSKGMANLCRAAGLSVQKIRELASTSDTPQREAYEDHYKGTISGGLNEFWTQAEYNVHFRIEKERLSVSISDSTYPQRIPPSDRSEGFQWYLSFYATLLNDVGVSNQTILLLDNPGLELHLDGQRDIKRFLEEKVSLTSQVIYVTHSPAMVDPFSLRQIRTVELQSNQNGTKINRFATKEGGDSDLLEPVRSAIGMSLISSLVFNEWNVLVEGAADKPITEGIFFSHYKEYREKILVNGSLSESRDAFLARFYHRAGLPYVILLDADNGGRDLFNELTRLGIPQDRAIRLEDVFGDREGDFALEDILSANFYHQAFMVAYPSDPLEQPAPGNRKRTNLYEDAFRRSHNIGFNKKRVAEAAKKLLAENREDEETRNNLGTLSTVIIERLRAQAPQPARPADAEKIAGTADS